MNNTGVNDDCFFGQRSKAEDAAYDDDLLAVAIDRMSHINRSDLLDEDALLSSLGISEEDISDFTNIELE